jgi:hypothetical protein
VSSAQGSVSLKSYSFITCADTDTAEYIEKLSLTVPLLVIDLMTIQKAAHTVTVLTCEKKDCKYTASTATVYITLGEESACHEIHHAAQHAALGLDVGVQVLDKGEYKTALEVSALASGIAAGSKYYTAGSAALLKEVQARFLAYDKIYGMVTCNQAYKTLKAHKFLAYSRDRLEKLEIFKELPDGG